MSKIPDSAAIDVPVVLLLQVRREESENDLLRPLGRFLAVEHDVAGGVAVRRGESLYVPAVMSALDQLEGDVGPALELAAGPLHFHAFRAAVDHQPGHARGAGDRGTARPRIAVAV